MRFVIAFSSIVLSASALFAQAPSPAPSTRFAPATVMAKDVIWGIKGGLAMPGVAWINDETEYDIETGLAFSAFVDYRLAPKLFGTLAIHRSNMSGDLSDVAPLTDVSLMFKGFIGGNPASQFAFRPSLGFGWGSDGDASYLMLHVYLEAIPLQTTRTWVVDGGIVVAPMGGNDAYDIVVEPRFVLRFGALF